MVLGIDHAGRPLGAEGTSRVNVQGPISARSATALTSSGLSAVWWATISTREGLMNRMLPVVLDLSDAAPGGSFPLAALGSDELDAVHGPWLCREVTSVR